jgi:ABC-type uncharacterized transport system permease subunit
MMLAIAILSWVGIIVSILRGINKDELEMSGLHGAIATIAWWEIAFPISIITMVLFGLVVILRIASEV